MKIDTYKKLWFIVRQLKPDWKKYVFAMILSPLAAVFEGIGFFLLPYLIGGLLSQNFDSLNMSGPIVTLGKIVPPRFHSQVSIFFLLVGLVYGASVLKNICKYFSKTLYFIETVDLNRKMKDYFLARFLSFGKLYFDCTSYGTLQFYLGIAGKIVNSVNTLQAFCSDLFMLVAYLVIMFSISWSMTIFVLVIFVTQYRSTNWLVARIRAISTKSTVHYETASKKLFNFITSIPLVKAYSREDEIKSDFSKLLKEIAGLEIKIGKNSQLMPLIQEMLVLSMYFIFIICVVAIYGISVPSRVAKYLVYFYLIKLATNNFASLVNRRAVFASLEPQVNEVIKVFDDTDKYFVPDGNVDFQGLERQITTHKLSFAYHPGVPVLKGINLTIEKGKMTAIVGPSGAGKSTLIHLIMRFYDSAPGSIFIDDHDVRCFHLKSLHTQMGFVSQDIVLFHDSIRANILFGLDRKVSEDEIIDVARRARLYDFIKSLPLGFETLIGDRGIQLSGGEKQRVAIARAILRQAEILFLDEATSSLDSQTEALIQEAIQEAVRGHTTIVIAHRLSTIKHADKIVVLEDGQLVEEGSLDVLLGRQGKFYEYWQAQKISSHAENEDYFVIGKK